MIPVRPSPRRAPRSRIAGREADSNGDGLTDQIWFAQTGGSETNLAPFEQNATTDTMLLFQYELSAAGEFPDFFDRYAAVLAAHEHKDQSLELPYQACRLGGFELEVSGTALLEPFPDLHERWPTFKDYRKCLFDAVDELADKRLYDKKVGRDVVITPGIRDLFRE
jgi:hypothetical protein